MNRQHNTFEKLLMIVGFAVVVVGMYILNEQFSITGWNLALITAGLIWLLLLFLIIVVAIIENSREESHILVRENSEQLRILRQISVEQVQEIKLLGQILLQQQEAKKKR